MRSCMCVCVFVVLILTTLNVAILARRNGSLAAQKGRRSWRHGRILWTRTSRRVCARHNTHRERDAQSTGIYKHMENTYDDGFVREIYIYVYMNVMTARTIF